MKRKEIAGPVLADREATGRKPAGRKMARKRLRRGRKPADWKIAGRKIARTKIARLQASGEEELQPLVTGPYRAWRRPRKKRITVFLDADVLAWFKENGRRYQTRINRALWEVVQKEKKEPGEYGDGRTEGEAERR